MKKILVIPHHPGLRKIKIRLVEIARTLSHHHKIYLLNWHSAYEGYGLIERIVASFKDLFKRTGMYEEAGLTIIEIPTLHRPLWLVQSFNSFFLNRLIKHQKFDVVINGSLYLFSIKNKHGQFQYIVDFADIPVSGKQGPFDNFVVEKTKKESKKADAITVISHGMVDYIKEQYGLNAFFIPNGADLNRMRACVQTEIESIREKYGLKNKCVIGYIGYIGPWVNVELAVESFRRMKREITDAILFWVGNSPHLKEIRSKYASEDIIFTGGIDGSIEEYFKALDIGLIPHKECPFQDMAFHLKLIEYTAAKKFVVSTRLKETQRLGFPNVIYASENVELWERAMLEARRKKWKDEWDNLVEPYSWEKIGKRFNEIIEKTYI